MIRVFDYYQNVVSQSGQKVAGEFKTLISNWDRGKDFMEAFYDVGLLDILHEEAKESINI